MSRFATLARLRKSQHLVLEYFLIYLGHSRRNYPRASPRPGSNSAKTLASLELVLVDGEPGFVLYQGERGGECVKLCEIVRGGTG